MKLTRNILGTVSGLIVFFIAGFILHLLLNTIIVFAANFNVSLSRTLEYAYNLTMILSAVAGQCVCSLVSVENDNGYKSGVILLGVSYILLGAVNFFVIIGMSHLSIADVFNSILSYTKHSAVLLSEITLVLMGMFCVHFATKDK